MIATIYNKQLDIFIDLVKQHNNKLSEKEIKKIYSSKEAKNLKEVINYILKTGIQSKEDKNDSEDFYKLKLLYAKTRVKDFPKLEFFKYINISLAKKFKLKVYRLFCDSHLFSDSRSLINLIGMCGLFEDDEKVNERLEKIISIFFYQDAFSTRKVLKETKNCNLIKNPNYELDDKIIEYIKEDLKIYLFKEISGDYLSFLKKITGTFGKNVNTIINPYKKIGSRYVLKDSAVDLCRQLFGKNINHIKNLTAEQYNALKKNKDYNFFIEPYKKTDAQVYGIKKNLSLAERKKALSNFKEFELTYGPSAIQTLFQNINPVFDLKFYNYFINHQSEISISSNNFSFLANVQREFENVIEYYSARGNIEPDYITIIDWLRKVPYNVKFGDEEIANEAKNAGVLKDGYDYYINLMEKVSKRHKRAIPFHSMFHTFIDKNDNKHILQTRILDGTDPLNMLIGESKYTDCCQKYNDLGQSCLEHASTSELGGIFIVNLVEDGVCKILSQSWVWINEQELVLDNIEQTSVLGLSTGDKRDLYEDMIAFAVGEAAEKIIIDSNKFLKKYIDTKLLKAHKLQRKSEIDRLNEILKRQTIKVVTIGSNYSDIIVSDYFPSKAKRKLCLPKDYPDDGYTDALTRYIAAGNEKNIDLEPNNSFAEESIYREKRKIIDKKINEYTNSELKKVLNMTTSFISNNYQKNIDKLIDTSIYNLNSVYLNCGEDWFGLYYKKSNGNKKIIDIIITTPRLDDEHDIQKNEISHFLIRHQFGDLNKLIKKEVYNEKNNTFI